MDIDIYVTTLWVSISDSETLSVVNQFAPLLINSSFPIAYVPTGVRVMANISMAVRVLKYLNGPFSSIYAYSL